MKELRDKVAVVTGGASGIGRGLADRFAAEGMAVVLADIEERALAEAKAELEKRGTRVLAVRTDVARGADVEALAERAYEAFGAVHVLCNNAGVSVGGPTWLHTVADWEWVLGVNLWGVIHGVRVFVPRMIAQGAPAHVVNTASVAGLTTSPMMSVYNVTKHGVVALSETLHKELKMMGIPIHVSVLCPGFVNTRIADSDRNRPSALLNAAPDVRPEALEQMVRAMLASGLEPPQVAEKVVEAIREERFYILTHLQFRASVRQRMEDIVLDRIPETTVRFD